VKKHKYLFCYFTLGVFAVFEGDSYFGVLHVAVLDSAPDYFVYGVGCFAAAVGAFIFLGLKRLNPSVKHGPAIAVFILAALLPCIAGFLQTPAAFWTSCILYYITEGVNAAVCAYYLHRLMKTEARAGTLLAAASIGGLVLTYVADFISPDAGVLKMAVIAVCVLAMLFLALRKIDLFGLLDSDDSEDVQDEGEQRGRFLTVFVTVTVVIAIMSYMIGVNDIAILSTLLSGPEPSIFIPQALLYLPALLIAGVLSDIKGGEYLPVATLGFTLLTAPAVTRLASPEVFTQYSGVTYFLGGFYLIYIMVSLVKLAGRSRRPVAVTSFAACLFFLFSGAGAFTSYFYIHADSAFSLTVYIGLVALLLVIFYLSGSLKPRNRNAESAQTQPPVPDAPALEELTAGYGITNRELKVLQLLIEGKNTAEIAQDMTITDKSVRNYVSSIMSKTASSSRVEIVARFTNRSR
jgi:DNA-binding CsgD family transcriptional regulator